MGSLVFIGDIHGNFKYLTWYVKNRDLENVSIIQVGDFGLGFNSYHNDISLMNDLNNSFKERNINLFAIRGNHDDPKFWDGHLNNEWTNVHLVPDYTVLNIEGYNILFVGGAISIDRKYRLSQMQKFNRNNLYWFDEKFILNEQILSDVRDIDIVVTHTSPDFCYPNNKNGFSSIVEEFAHHDKNLKNELTEERELLTRMWQILKENNSPRIWLHGHFHNSNKDTLDGCDFRLLGINESYHYRGKNYEDDLNRLYGE